MDEKLTGYKSLKRKKIVKWTKQRVTVTKKSKFKRDEGKLWYHMEAKTRSLVPWLGYANDRRRLVCWICERQVGQQWTQSWSYFVLYLPIIANWEYQSGRSKDTKSIEFVRKIKKLKSYDQPKSSLTIPNLVYST